MKFMGYAPWAITLGLLLSACGTKPLVLDGYEDRTSPVNFKIVDLRPAMDKTSERLSAWATSCSYEIHRIGDEQTVPSKLVILQRDMEDALGSKLRNVTMKLKQYRIFYNNRAAMLGQVKEFTPGVLTSALKSAGDSCSKEDTIGGWYAGSEVTTPFSPFVVEIEAEIEGRTYMARTVFSTHDSYVGVGGPSNYFFEVIHQANVAFIGKLR